MTAPVAKKQRGPGRPFKPGQSGNPTGRKPGTGLVQQFRQAMAGHMPRILKALIDKAAQGDAQAIRIIVDRMVPVPRAAEEPISLPLPAGSSLTEKAEAILKAGSEGAITPDQTAKLVAALGALARVHEVESLERRVAALEAGNGNDSKQG